MLPNWAIALIFLIALTLTIILSIIVAKIYVQAINEYTKRKNKELAQMIAEEINKSKK